MPRACTICTSDRRNDAERAYFEGRSIRGVAADLGFSGSSAARHFTNHVRDSFSALSAIESAATVANFAGHVRSLIADAAQVRERAAVAGDDALRLRAIKTEADLIAVLSDRLGIQDESAEDDLANADALRRAVAYSVGNGALSGDGLDIFLHHYADAGAPEQDLASLRSLASRAITRPTALEATS
ncbi:hypothetical protein [Rathayibacter sp. VKM Ac-2927]|uniref:hypothetical protein n=1 Tax=Rathayibacter sp. VKM Ac-2927 TaxID=2929478 RepID=UPI001FB33195|nr:hypothetical protein [Rathayibacter sp. VKM Ac-2927]MCJ1687867.1 hypothetical protein [Rathayibacter sp. VKM Ac-2927]